MRTSVAVVMGLLLMGYLINLLVFAIKVRTAKTTEEWVTILLSLIITTLSSAGVIFLAVD